MHEEGRSWTGLAPRRLFLVSIVSLAALPCDTYLVFPNVAY